MSKLGELPEGVDSAMFLRDGWPDACVCKVVMKDGRVGIGLHRPFFPPVHPEEFDRVALEDAVANLSDAPPDYRPIQEYAARMKAQAEEDAALRARAEAGREDLEQAPHDEDDLQASLGQKAHG